MRAAFEEWISAAPYELDITRPGECSSWPRWYDDFRTQQAWEAWQESASRIPSPEAIEAAQDALRAVNYFHGVADYDLRKKCRAALAKLEEVR
jgi:hypothetical protein